MKRTIFTALVVLLAFGSCKQNEQKPTEPAPAEKAEFEQDNAAVWKDDISLDEGRMWKANQETTEGILAMSSLVENSSPSNVEEYRELGNSLNEKINEVIKKCTMKGPSHDNLHIYLQPLIEKIAALQEAPTTQKAEELVGEIRQHLKDYHSYFV